MKLTREAFERRPADYRGSLQGYPSCIRMDPETGATVLEQVEIVEILPPELCEHDAIRVHQDYHSACNIVTCLDCGASAPASAPFHTELAAQTRGFLRRYPRASTIARVLSCTDCYGNGAILGADTGLLRHGDAWGAVHAVRCPTCKGTGRALCGYCHERPAVSLEDGPICHQCREQAAEESAA